MASSYTEHQWQRDLVNKMTSLVLNNINWLGVPFNSPSTTFESSTSRPTVRVLDYACGPGTVTGALTDHATGYIGIDLSDGMVNEYNSRFSKDASSSPAIHCPQPSSAICSKMKFLNTWQVQSISASISLLLALDFIISRTSRSLLIDSSSG